MALKHICKPSTQVSKAFKRFYSAPGDREIPAAKLKYVPTSGTYPKGFRVSSTHVGVKASNTRYDDLAFITSDTPCSAAGTFTKNAFKAAPVTVSKQRLSGGAKSIRGVIINSGCANAVTGKGGIEDANQMCQAADAALGVQDSTSQSSNLVMSTGVIGQRLPIDKIIAKIPTAAEGLGDSHDHWLGAAKAICTTDTFPKLISRQFKLPGFDDTFTMTGLAKGAGMIHPNMGTLLSVICTDAPIVPQALQVAIRTAVNSSFNCISIDGDTSTNDTVLCLANGYLGKRDGTDDSDHRIGNVSTPDVFGAFQSELTAICTELAKLIVRDGEGATKFVTIRIKGAESSHAGRAIAKTIAKSPLVKTALYGQDANWGRILCAVGYSPSETGGEISNSQIIPEKTSVSFVPATDGKEGEELKLLVNGEPQNVDEELAAKMLKEEDLEILVRLRPEDECEGTQEVVYWTCDFSHEYVTINGDYRT